MKQEFNIYGISDNHFLHDNILGFTYGENNELLRPEFKNPQDMNERMRAVWNSTVRPQDLIIIVGDLVWTKGISEAIKTLLRSLNGRKILVRGNHDKKSYSWYMANGIDFVCDRFSWDFNGKRILFIHNPDHISDSDYGKYDIILHGHVHRNRPFIYRRGDTYIVNLSAEIIRYRPMSLSPLFNRITQGFYRV